ncbi:hypothetical protein IT409_01095 [Candidatus Falkowbacteria bacterium]|nr:hypothetical protein [Candidatus Falkowbacteria bacterium]
MLQYFKTFVRVFKNPRYTLLAIIVAIGLFCVSALIMNHSLVRFALTSDFLSATDTWKLLVGVVPTLINSTKGASLFLTIIAFIASGINVALLVYYMTHRVKVMHATGVGVLGVLISLVGVGCGACGSVLLTTLLGVGAGTRLLGALPFAGLEFSVVAIGIVVASSIYLLNIINKPDVCPIK